MTRGIFGAVLLLLLALISPTSGKSGEIPGFKPGDLAEYTTGFGATVGEVVSGPDASGFYVLRVPTAGDLPIHRLKLRLLQTAGTPNAPVQAGQSLTVHTGNGETVQSRILKVNGAWCRVQSPGIVGWVRCTPDPLAQGSGTSGSSAADDAKDPPSALRGTYANADRSVKLEFASGGVAHFSQHGLTLECTHRQHTGHVIVRCENEDTQLAIGPDGSLSGPAESPMAQLKKP